MNYKYRDVQQSCLFKVLIYFRMLKAFNSSPTSSCAKLVLTSYIRIMEQDFLNKIMGEGDISMKNHRLRTL